MAKYHEHLEVRSRREVATHRGEFYARDAARTFSTMEPMTRITIEVDEQVAERVREAAAERGVAPEQLAGQVLAEQFPARRRHLAFAAVGASGSPRGAAQADELLAEGFGRD